jgi:hypothetical protein
MLLAAFSPALALTSLITAPGMSIANINGSTSVSSYNWGGYAVTASSVTSVSGSWVVPTITPIPGASPTTTYYAAFWVGFDGYSSSTVEQTGILSETTGASTTYLAWYEFYPSPMYAISSLTIRPGDTIFASVTYSGSSGKGFFGRSSSAFTVTIIDETTGKSFSKTGTVSNAARSSAEWIVETPSVNGRLASLANFTTVSFGSCDASTTTIPTQAIGSFSNVYAITIYNYPSATTIMASPSPLSSDGASFSVTWASAGP